MGCSTQDKQIEKIDDYLKRRHHEGQMSIWAIACELSVGHDYAQNLCKHGTIKSRHTRAVAEYIVKHT